MSLSANTKMFGVILRYLALFGDQNIFWWAGRSLTGH
jgi:hypothetical protein